MLKRISFIIALIISLASVSLAQNANTSTQPATRKRISTTKTSTPQENKSEQNTNASTVSRGKRAAGETAGSAKDTGPRGVLAAFNNLLDGIRHSDVEKVANAYWKSSQLVLFNNNGTVTRGWEQMKENRASSYPNMKDVKLDVRDMRVQMLGRDGALVTCLWTQSQTYRGTPETASGRMTIVFRLIGGSWKAVHLHTSPDAPNPARVPASEQATPKTEP
ncbi:MAG: nuclear transport factor 2 family protein [Pyrinomonadaceae bacterium]